MRRTKPSAALPPESTDTQDEREVRVRDMLARANHHQEQAAHLIADVQQLQQPRKRMPKPGPPSARHKA
jgi:F0F1-type ATP synthase membrane subunit b/b'